MSHDGVPALGGGKARVSRDSVFLSYRRAGDQQPVGRLADDLREYFGHEYVYRDLDSNRSAQDYVVQIDEALRRSKVVLAVIGPMWLGSTSADGSIRLQNPGDLVRLEIERALAAGVRVVPVLVGGAVPPATADLPPSLASLSLLQASPMRDGDWHYDLGRLFETLEDHGVVPRPESDERLPVDVKKVLAKGKRYERTVRVPRRSAYDALVGTVELLHYAAVDRSAESAQVSFTTKRRKVVTKVVDAGPGTSTVVIEFDSVRGSVLAGGALALSMFSGPGVFVGWAALRAWERRFAVGFLDNVERVLEGRGVEEDSSLPLGVHKWRTRSREV